MINMNIYKITNLINNKIYIGCTKRSIITRFHEHGLQKFAYKSLITRSILKYGKENFDIQVIETCNSLKEMNTRENYWINKLNALYPNGYNLKNEVVVFTENSFKNKMTKKCMDAGHKARLGSKHSEETRKKMSLSAKKPKLHKRKAIIAIDLITKKEFHFESVNKASECLNIKRRSISNVLNNWRQDTHNFTFRYVEVSHRT